VLQVDGQPVGAFGELHPKVAANFGLGERAVQVAELDLEAILAAVPERFAYRPIPTTPPAKRDVAVIVPADTPAEKVLAELRAAGGGLPLAASPLRSHRPSTESESTPCIRRLARAECGRSETRTPGVRRPRRVGPGPVTSPAEDHPCSSNS